MRLRRGKARYRIPGADEIMTITVGDSGKVFILQEITADLLGKIKDRNRKGPHGLPRYFVHNRIRKVIDLWPVPNRAYEMRIRYATFHEM